MARLPVISGDEAIRAFEKAGWVRRRQVGSHVALDKEGEGATLAVPRHRELDKGLLRRLIRDAGLSIDGFVALLGRRTVR
ncbi:MAG TPA: type II toxin-antitoxin system HicA family toxin [Armatimonadota bacterium]|nr:type II toxin-antitoxin system HicA family toxin [Armatimonadota bacterium]